MYIISDICNEYSFLRNLYKKVAQFIYYTDKTAKFINLF